MAYSFPFSVKKIIYIISDIDKALAFEWIAERINASLIEISFVLIIQKPSALEKFLREKNIPVYTFYYRNKKELPLIFLKLYRLLKRLKPDAVHCHLLYASLLGLTASRIAGIKNRIYTRHHSDFHHRYFPAGIKWDKWCNAMSTRIIAPSNTVSEVLIQLEHVHPAKVSLVPHGFDLDYFRSVASKLIDELKVKYTTGDQYPVIGVISRFTELKGIQFIIPAFIKLLNVYPDALILFFNAKGDYESEIKQLLGPVQERNYRLIHFENNLAAVYQLFDIFIQVSTDTQIEAFGQTYVEALAAGVPSVFTLSGIANEFIVDGENALVVPFKDAEAIHFAIKRILSEPDLREHLKQNGCQSVKENFGLEKMIHQLELLYAG